MFRLFQKTASNIRSEPPANFTLKQQRDRAADELVGICRGVLSDGTVTSQEASFLKIWIERNSHYATEYPFNYLYQRIATALTDGVLDSDEEADLLDTLVALVGGESNIQNKASLSSSLPLCVPAPTISYVQSIFVVTGTFVYGSRANVVVAIESKGASVVSNVSGKVRFLVIGEIGSQAWKHSSYGRKIEKAVQLRDDGKDIHIVSEEHWRSSLT